MRLNKVKCKEGVVRYDGLAMPFTGYWGIAVHKEKLLENLLNCPDETYLIADLGCGCCLQHPKLIDYLETKSKLADRPKKVKILGIDIAETYLLEIVKGAFIYDYIGKNKKYFILDKEGFTMRTKWRARLNLIIGDLRNNLPSKDSSFNAVIAENVIYHLPFPDRHKVMKEILRILKPKGYLPDSLLEYKNNNLRKEKFKKL